MKSTYTFHIRSCLPVLASGLPTGSHSYERGDYDNNGTLLYTFRQDVPIPSYLFAIASGELACATIGPRSTIWTSPHELLDCQWELARDMERIIQTGESIVYPYVWGTYNVLILPASFPFGGKQEKNIWLHFYRCRERRGL